MGIDAVAPLVVLGGCGLVLAFIMWRAGRRSPQMWSHSGSHNRAQKEIK